MKLGLYPNWKAKEKVFAYFFKGMTLEAFDELCQRFAKDHLYLLRPQGVEAINLALNEGTEVLIVSASIDNWVRPFFKGIRILGTQIEVEDGRLTGRFLTKNCYGQEKVNRILALYPHREDYHLTAYGDSRGDRELMAFADEAHYKEFQSSDENEDRRTFRNKARRADASTITAADALEAIGLFKGALVNVSSMRSYYGAMQNRLEHTIKNLDNVVENTQAAESRIRDTDMAEEMVRYSNQKILEQAGQAMLAQANQTNQGVLALLQ